METGTIIALMLYLIFIGFLSVITSESFTTKDRIVTYLISSIIFAVIVFKDSSNSRSNIKKQEYKSKKYVIKTGTDKDTIIINKKY